MSCDGNVGEWALLQPFRWFTQVTAHSPNLPLLYIRHSSFSSPSVDLLTTQLILQPFRCFTYVTAHSPTLSLLHLRYSSFSNPSVALPTSQLILQPFRCFTYVTAHSPTLPLLYLRYSSFSNHSFASPTSQALHLRHVASRPWYSALFRHEHMKCQMSAHFPRFLSLHLRHSSFSNPSVSLPTSQLILQPFRRFTYVTAHSPTLPLLYLRYSSFSNPSFTSPTSQALHYVTWRAAHDTARYLDRNIWNVKCIALWLS